MSQQQTAKSTMVTLQSHGLTPAMLKALAVTYSDDLEVDEYRVNQLIAIALDRIPAGVRNVRDWAIRKLTLLDQLPPGIKPRWKRGQRRNPVTIRERSQR